ncbi:hypothetical protein D3C84_872400 [compost metagenome]
MLETLAGGRAEVYVKVKRTGNPELVVACKLKSLLAPRILGAKAPNVICCAAFLMVRFAVKITGEQFGVAAEGVTVAVTT